jgi:rhamnulose-1-phosphate aldolase
MMEANVAGLRVYRSVVWSKHGVMARSASLVTCAADRIAYAETAALYEDLNLVSGNRADGRTVAELREIVAAFKVQTTLVYPCAKQQTSSPLISAHRVGG